MTAQQNKPGEHPARARAKAKAKEKAMPKPKDKAPVSAKDTDSVAKAEPPTPQEKPSRAITGYCTTSRYKLHDGSSGITYGPRNNGRMPAQPDEINGWLKAQIAAGLIEEF